MTDVTPKSLEELQAAPAPASVSKSQPNPDAELNILFPTPAEFDVNGEKVVVRVFKFGELTKVLELLRGIGPMYFTMLQNGMLKADNPEMQANMMALISEGGESLFKLLALNIRKPREWLDEIDMDVGIVMILKMIEVNLNFFLKNVLPVIAVVASKTHGART